MAKKVLVLEDIVPIRRSAVKHIEAQGHEAVEYDSVTGVLANVELASLDAALLDVRVKGTQTGIDLLRILRAEGIQIPAVIWSGDLDGELEAEALGLGAACFWKPLPVGQEFKAILTALGLSHL